MQHNSHIRLTMVEALHCLYNGSQHPCMPYDWAICFVANVAIPPA